MSKGQENDRKAALVGKSIGAIGKLRANNAELASALGLKRQECEEMKQEILELKAELQVSEQHRFAINNALIKWRSLLKQLSLHIMGAGDGVFELCKELNACFAQEDSNTNTSPTTFAATENFKKLYHGRDELLAVAGGDNLSIIVERSSVVDESPQPSGSGLHFLDPITDTKGRAPLPLLSTILEKPKRTDEKKKSKVVTGKVKGSKVKSILHKAKKMKQTQPRMKLEIPLPLEEMPAFKPKFQIPRTPTKNSPAVNEDTQSKLMNCTAVCNLERLISTPKENNTASSSPKKVTPRTRTRSITFEDTTRFDGQVNATYQKTPIPAGVLMQNANEHQSPAQSPIKILQSSVPFLLDESITPSDDPIVLQDLAGPSNGVEVATKVKKPRKKARTQVVKEFSDDSDFVPTKKRVVKRKSRRNMLIDEVTVKSESPKVTPSPKKKKQLEKSPAITENMGRRARSAVSYKEPSICRKMRRN